MNDVHDQVEGLSNFVTAKNLAVPFPYTEKDSIAYISKHMKNNPSTLKTSKLKEIYNKIQFKN